MYIHRFSKKVNLRSFLCRSWSCMRSAGIAPFILNDSTRRDEWEAWRFGRSTSGKALTFTLNRKLLGSQTRSQLLPLKVVEPRFLGRRTRSLVSIPTESPWPPLAIPTTLSRPINTKGRKIKDCLSLDLSRGSEKDYEIVEYHRCPGRNWQNRSVMRVLSLTFAPRTIGLTVHGRVHRVNESQLSK
jgi:hypothetical protein